MFGLPPFRRALSPLATATARRTSRTFSPAGDAALEGRVVLSHAIAHPHAAAVAALATTPHTVSVKLSPPNNTFRSELAATVGRTPGVKVGELTGGQDGPYQVQVTVKSPARAVAMASVLAGSHDFGGIKVTVQVVGRDGQVVQGTTPTSAANLVHLEQAAFTGNHLFVRAVDSQASPYSPEAVFPVFTPSVVQFYDDNIADLYHNTNMTAAAAFTDVLAPAPGGIFVSASTARL